MPYYSYYGGFDKGYLLVLIAFGLAMLASFWVKSTFSRYAKVPSSLSGAEAARYVLDQNGLDNVRIERVAGDLTDHYNPTNNVLALSDSTYDSHSAAAVGVACHEAGHAIQHAAGYAPVKWRTSLVPVVNLGSQAALPLFALGLFMQLSGLMWVGIILFSLTLLFGLVTLPVEIDASRRALRALKTDPTFSQSDYNGAKRVLTAAASTYLASAFMSLAQLIRFIGLANSSRNNRD